MAFKICFCPFIFPFYPPFQHPATFPVTTSSLQYVFRLFARIPTASSAYSACSHSSFAANGPGIAEAPRFSPK